MLKYIENHFLSFILAGIVLGLLFPQLGEFKWILPYKIFAIMLITSLKIDFGDLLKEIKNWKMIVGFVLFFMIIFPILVFNITNFFVPWLALGGLLLASLPSAVSNAAIADILKGDKVIALILTTITSLICPIIITGLFFLLAGKMITIDLVSLFSTLVLVVVVPFLLGNGLRKIFRNKILDIEKFCSPLSILLVGLTVSIAIGYASPTIFGTPEKVFYGLIYTLVIGLVLMFLGLIFIDHSKARKIAVSMSSFRVNLGLGLAVATMYFTPEVVLVVVAYQLIIDALLVPFKMIVERVS